MIGFMRLLLCFLFLIVSAVPAYSAEPDGKVLLKKGKEALKRGNYAEAITSLSGAEKDIPLLGDYALLWLSDAHRKIGDHKESLETLRTLMKKYPRSPLIKKARSMEIEEAEAISEENMQRLYRAFIREYPKDMEMKYLYASWLKRTGHQDKARSIFKEIYIAAGSFSQKASRELRPADISVKDLMKRASNLMKAYNFKKAESVFREALAKEDGQFKREILDGLGLSLFRQKKYREAADVYEKARSTYWQVRSLYRAGEGKAFNAAFGKLKRSGSRMTGKVLIWLARDYRRDGEIEKALETFQTVKEQYPRETEDALWGIGWTYFRAGDYKKAADTFTNLYKTYHDTQYLYWKARSLAEDGQDASKVYATLAKKDRDFYSDMAYLQLEKAHGQSGIIKPRKTSTRVKTIKPAPDDRVEALLDLDFFDEAISELQYTSKNARSLGDILYICLKYQELEQYKNLVGFSLKLPNGEEFYQFRYPRAYKEIVEGLSVKYKVDPLLVFSVAREESRFDPHAKSIAGALGIMQIMPQTAKRLDRKLKLGARRSYEILDIEKNFHLGIYLMSKNIREFGSYSGALAAYNAGGHRVRTWLRQGEYKSADEFIEDIPYSETRKYVKRVLGSYFEYKRIFSQKDDDIEISLEKL
jgi:soluble lytic murein transglycosylase